MNIRDRYKKTFSHYYDSVMNDEEVLQMIDQRCSSRKKHPQIKWAAIALAAVLIVISTTYVTASVGLYQLSNIFRKYTNDPVSADLVASGTVQRLNIVGEHEDFSLKLAAFTGDVETHRVLFELTPREDLGDYEIRLVGQTSSPDTIESKNGMWFDYLPSEVAGTKVTSDKGKNVYYFNYELPQHWVKETNEDVLMRISAIKLYDENQLADIISCDLLYQFTPDRSILQEPLIMTVNEQVVKKDVYDDFGTPYEYEDDEFYKDEVIASKNDRTLMIDDVVFSNYRTEIKTRIMDQDITRYQASLTRHQCIVPVFVTKHFWNGTDDSNSYNMVLIENTERFRLFADGAEVPLIEEDEYMFEIPGKGEDGYYHCSFYFEGFDYKHAQSIELHFGEQVITLK